MRLISLIVFAVISATLTFAQSPDGDSVPRLISAEEYQLSPEAKSAGIDGRMILRLWIDKTGTVTKAETVVGPAWPCASNPKREIADVREQVRQTIMKARFSPAMKDSKPRDIEVTLTFLLGEKLKAAMTRQEAEQEMRANPSLRGRGGVINGKATQLPKPEYPFAARGSRAGGPVTVDIDVDEQGNVHRAQAINGHPLLRDSARDAACKAKFSPTILDGKPIRVSGMVTFNFVPPRPGTLPQ